MRGGFTTTHWSRVLEAREGTGPEARQALETLCRTYWPPLYAFVRRQGHDPEAARDLTQGYFAELLDKDLLQGVERSGGRFRAFLLASLRHFLAHQRERERALKRGGGAQTLSLDSGGAGAALAAEVPDRLTPEQVFERQWALTVVERALERLRHAAAESGSGVQFERLKGYLTGEAGRAPYSEVAEELGMAVGAVRGAVHRLRRRFGRMLRAEIVETLADPADADDEIRYLLSVIQPWEGAGP